mgnify:CR=1 FL=1
MDEATRVFVEAPLFGLDAPYDPGFPEEAPSPSRDPPTATRSLDSRVSRRGARSLAVPLASARALEQYRPSVERAVRRWGVPSRDAPDVAQKLLIDLLPKWGGKQGRVPDKPREYVLAAARRAAKQYLRHERGRPELLVPPGAASQLPARALSEESEVKTAEEVLVSAAEREELAGEIAANQLDAVTTPERWRVFHAYVVIGQPAKEIANIEQAPIGTIYNRIRLARRDLRAAILRLRAANRRR